MTMIGKHLPYMQDIPADIQKSIQMASGVSGEPVEHLTRVMNLESSGNPRATNKSRAKGLFQIMPKTWASLQKDNPDRKFTDVFNPQQNAVAAGILNKQYRDILSKRLNRPATNAEVSGAHYLGPEGYLSLVRNPEATARDLFSPKTYTQNKNAFVGGGQDRTGRQVIDYLNTRYKSAPTALPRSSPPSYDWGKNNNITFNDKRNYTPYNEPKTTRYTSVTSTPRSYTPPKSRDYSPQPDRIEMSPSTYKPSSSDTVRKYWKGGTSFSDRDY